MINYLLNSLFLRKYWLFFVLFNWLLSLTVVNAAVVEGDEFVFQPRITTGVMNYSYELDSKSDTTPIIAVKGSDRVYNDHGKFKMSDNLFIVGIGGILSHRGFFFDAFYQKSVNKGKEEGSEKYVTNGISDTSTGKNEFDRVDYAITFGYNVTDNIAVFGGYKSGKMESEIANTTIYQPIFTLNDQQTLSTAEYPTDVRFESSGVFIGANYTIPIGKGALGFNAAFTKLSGEFSSNTNWKVKGENLNENVYDIDWFITGDTIGYSLGIKWAAPITDKLSYGISLDRYGYNFGKDQAYIHEIDYDSATLKNMGYLPGEYTTKDHQDFDMKESAWSVRVGLSYSFDL